MSVRTTTLNWNSVLALLAATLVAGFILSLVVATMIAFWDSDN